MKIFAVTPIHVGRDELHRRQVRYDRLAPAGLSIDLHDLPPDAPAALESEADIRRSEELVADALSGASLAGYAASLPDCVLDPAVRRMRRATPPVFGILRSTLGALVGAGHTVGAVTRNQAIAAEFADLVAAYGMDHDFLGVEVLDVDFDAIADDRRWNAALAQAVERLHKRGATAVVNGCSAVDLEASETNVWVVDPTALAVRVVALVLEQSGVGA